MNDNDDQSVAKVPFTWYLLYFSKFAMSDEI